MPRFEESLAAPEDHHRHAYDGPHVLPQPDAAIAAAPEQLAYVAAFDPKGQTNDALAVVDCDTNSSTYGSVVGWAELPTAGNELHHFGWNACSSALCHEGHGHHEALKRRYLLSRTDGAPSQ